KKRDFQRTFMLKYSDEMTSAVIMNDMLMVSNLNIGDEKSHTVLIKELSKATGLAQRYAHDCLKQNHWDYHQALESFTEMKESNSLPDSVFM
ncbi:MAG: nuclear mRNA export, poly(A)+RNA binding protein, partial [Paramarteilia canceri]